MLDLRFDASAGDIDMNLYNAAGTQLDSSTSYTDNEFIDYEVPDSGNYYVKIYFENMGNEYDFRYESRDPLQTEDNYEENDDIGSAFNLTAYEQTWISTIHGIGIQLDEDWYEIAVTPGNERLVVDVRFQDNQGDIDIAVYDMAGTLITSSRSTTDNEYIDYILPSAGTYFISLDDYYGPGNFYDLWWAQLDSGDIISPIISDISYIPDRPNDRNNIEIQAVVIDNTGLALVNVIFREGGGKWQSAEMTEVSGDHYAVNLGSFDLNTGIEFFIIAIDVSTNQNMAIDDNYEDYYEIKVARKIPGFPALWVGGFGTIGIILVFPPKFRPKIKH